MTTNTKLSKVLEYLIKNEEDKARELLHQVFIEKARAIHEELMSMDEEMLDDDMEEGMHGDEVGGSGNLGHDLTNEIESMDDEIDFEETMSEGEPEEVEGEVDVDAEDGAGDEIEMDADVSDDVVDDADGDVDVDDAVSPEGKKVGLNDALAQLLDAFNKMKEDAAGDTGNEEEADAVSEETEEEESWELDEDFDDLAESLDLAVIEKDPLKGNKTEGEVGSASSGMAIEKNAKSPLPKSQTSRMGAEPVKTGLGGTHNGYNMEASPKVDDMGHGDNRRKKASDGSKSVPAPKNSDAASNKKSPLTNGGSNLK